MTDPRDEDIGVLQRSAENWFGDAVTYTQDGNYEEAIKAAKRGVDALERMIDAHHS